jgi:hypothetical protein
MRGATTDSQPIRLDIPVEKRPVLTGEKLPISTVYPSLTEQECSQKTTKFGPLCGWHNGKCQQYTLDKAKQKKWLESECSK